MCNINYCSKTVSSVKDTLFNSSNKKTALEGCEKLCRKLDDTIGMYFIGYIDGNESTQSKTNNADRSGRFKKDEEMSCNSYLGCIKDEAQSIQCPEGTYKFIGMNSLEKINNSGRAIVKERDNTGLHKKQGRAHGSSSQ